MSSDWCVESTVWTSKITMWCSHVSSQVWQSWSKRLLPFNHFGGLITWSVHFKRVITWSCFGKKKDHYLLINYMNKFSLLSHWSEDIRMVDFGSFPKEPSYRRRLTHLFLVLFCFKVLYFHLHMNLWIPFQSNVWWHWRIWVWPDSIGRSRWLHGMNGEGSEVTHVLGTFLLARYFGLVVQEFGVRMTNVFLSRSLISL